MLNNTLLKKEKKKKISLHAITSSCAELLNSITYK